MSSLFQKCFVAFNVQPLLLSHFSHVQLFSTPWIAAHQVPPSMGFSRQQYSSLVMFISRYFILFDAIVDEVDNKGFSIYSVNVIYYTDWFSYIKPSLHSRKKSHVIMCIMLLICC